MAHRHDEFLRQFGSQKFVFRDLSILIITGSGTSEIASFPTPTVDQIIEKRPHVLNHWVGLEYQETEEKKKQFISKIRSQISPNGYISAVYFCKGLFWLGFGFYEGEGSEGLGGLGFFDPKSNEIGLFRHPALIDFSIEEMYVNEDWIFAKTVGSHELGSSYGNGLVKISKTTLNATATVPKGTKTIWDKDSYNVNFGYQTGIRELMKDPSFISKRVKKVDLTTKKVIKKLGVKNFLIKELRKE